jgi:hypothetical protein
VVQNAFRNEAYSSLEYIFTSLRYSILIVCHHLSDYISFPNIYLRNIAHIHIYNLFNGVFIYYDYIASNDRRVGALDNGKNGEEIHLALI